VFVCRYSCVVGEDDGVDGGDLRSLLAATTLRHRARGPQAVHLELRAHPAGLDRLPLAGSEQLLLEPDCLLLDKRHPTSWLHVRTRHVVSVLRPSARHPNDHLCLHVRFLASWPRQNTLPPRTALVLFL